MINNEFEITLAAILKFLSLCYMSFITDKWYEDMHQILLKLLKNILDVYLNNNNNRSQM